MKLSSIAKLKSGHISAAEYSAEIAGELAMHSLGLGPQGGVAPVQVTEDTDLLVDRAVLGTLCRLFASGQLTALELAYTADALQMADRVQLSGEDIASDLAECTDPEINGQLTVARALEIASASAAA
ncbi:hypothetical protein N790_14790 [Arenimonas malthae CC-JY-1]|uniref:Uncharacterized protein n=1 Tax=Arenimonas malthae CC-JY-1 TaxID=1384054 RepID=A0A091BI67_9GAMM|nr:hypothetical protein [Arenimonas malthae]KFN51426.1 hypothetical protein N790_14790 [Arenimonas malthae CC-JY-1]